jgi:hypothetical protein
MRNKTFIIAVFTIVLLAGSLVAADLTAIEVPAARRAEFLRFGIPVYREVGTTVFAGLDAQQLADLRNGGWLTQVLDPEMEAGDYFLVPRVRAGKHSAPALQLWENERYRLVRLTETEALAARTAGFELVRLATHPHPLTPVEPAGEVSPLLPDTLIQRLVDSVSLDSLLRTLTDLQAYGTRYTYSPKCDSAARYIGRRFTELGLVPEYDRYRAGVQRDTSWNVIATIPGTVHPESIVVACAHYDSYSDTPYVWAPGADDNGTGTAALIELARVLRETPFRWTVTLAAFSGEEQWMLGSGHWVDSTVVPQGMLIAGVYNLDMFCYTAYDSTRMYVITNLASRPLAVRAESVNVHYGIGLNLINYRDDDCAGDNTPFWEHGIKAVFALEDSEWGIWNGSNPNYHTGRDIVANLRPGQLLRGTRLALACLASLATPWPASGVAERPRAAGRAPLAAIPNPFIGFARIPGHEAAYFRVYDAQGRQVALDPGGRLGKGLAPGVYLVRRAESASPPIRIVKLR